MAYRSTGQQQWEKEVTETINGGLPTMVRAQFSLSFPAIPLGTPASGVASASGAKVGDFVLLVPSMATVGLIFSGVVTTDGSLTIYAQNYTTDTVSPGTVSFSALLIR